MERIKSGKAKKGDTILFERKDTSCEGEVFLVRENSVLVEISREAARIFGYETPNTVVGHGNYMIIKKV
ncbi:YkvS family protein [Bacillus sp. V33-4]|uniref:YkvS family protein n=1 Tax=Bacillus sp. V33-4 TaxID=2054169 RepID=UPI00215546EF|nr:YkvS family protein [Bacillus sp. V33-4]